MIFFEPYLSSFKQLGLLTLSLWAIYLITWLIPSLEQYGIRPREISGLWGIFTAPFIHGNLTHIIANTGSLLTLGTFFIFSEKRFNWEVLAALAVIGGSLTWIFARDASHVGISGVIFGIFGYLLSLAIFQVNVTNIFISLIMLVAYSGMFFGLLPLSRFISWESHLFGFIAGIALAKFKGKWFLVH